MKPNRFGTAATISLLSLVYLIAFVWIYRSRMQAMKSEVESYLIAVAKLETDRLNQWRTERLYDADDITSDPPLTNEAKDWMSNPQAKGRERLLLRFAEYRKAHSNSTIILTDARGIARISLDGANHALPHDVMQALIAAFHDHKPKLTDLYAVSGESSPQIGCIAPLFDSISREPIGAVLFIYDARRVLYPLIRNWPLPSETAEVLIVRRDGDNVLFLNDLRHLKNTALKRRIPLTRTEVPAVQAVLGERGVVEGRDYRSHDVLSAIEAVPDSSWLLVAKIDKAEALSIWRDQSTLLLALFLAISTGIAGFAWQRRGKTHYQSLYMAESERLRSEERYRTVLMSVGDGVIVTDSKGRVEMMNSVAESLTGWSESEARGESISEIFKIVNERSRLKVESPVDRVLREGIVVGLANHTMLIARDGTERPIADSGAPVRNDSGANAGVVLVFRDQTRERWAEAALRESEQRYRDLTELSPDAILVHQDGRCEYVNDATVRLLGAEGKEALLGANIFDRVHPDYHEIVRQRINEVVSGDGFFVSHEERWLRVDGSVIDVEVVAKSVRHPNGNAVQVIARDITERKQANEERESLQAQLLQSQKMEAIGRLAGGVAHDLNNLLTPILLHSEMLERQANNDASIKSAQGIQQACLRARDMIQQLLAFGRKQILEIKTVDLNEAIESFVPLLRRTIRDDIDMALHLCPGSLTVRIDAGQFEQALMNLVVNAQDAMPDGGSISVETRIIAGDANHDESNLDLTSADFVEVAIRDTGVGMDESVLEHIFTPFFTTKEKGKGTGLGLATVYGIIHQHDGDIRAVSEPGKGSCFIIRLPAEKTAISKHEAEERCIDLIGGTETLIVVEDNEMILKLMNDTLAKLGYAVLSASNADECLKRLEGYSGALDLLLTDVIMPGMSGKDLANLVTERFPKIKVVFMSGYSENEIAPKGALDEGTHFLQKPFSMQALTSEIREALSE